MIAHIRGQLFSKLPSQAIVEANGVGYDIAISVATYSSLPAEGAQVALYIHTQVREDALALYGFSARSEKQLFERLITVTGVGPRLALTILSGLSAEQAIAAIRAQDHASLTRIPGVGKRLAERLVVELKDKLNDLALPGPAPQQAGPAADDVLSALVNLGYNRAAAQKALETAVAKEKAAGKDFDTLFRAALLLIR
jgi:Holliday junction DNA helicase RuvA